MATKPSPSASPPRALPVGPTEEAWHAMATLIEPSAVKKILALLGLLTEPLPRTRAREQETLGFDADAVELDAALPVAIAGP